jgi:hypothetical protein
MSFSVTENASSVTDVKRLLSSLGFDASSRLAYSELLIDEFDQWSNPSGNSLYGTLTGCTRMGVVG